MLVMEHGGELSAEEQDQTRNVAPRQYSDDRADRSVNLIVVKVVKTQREDVLCYFPQQSCDKRARQSVAQSDICLRHETVDQHEERHGYEITHGCEEYLPERAADGCQQRVALDLPRRKASGHFAHGNQNR